MRQHVGEARIGRVAQMGLAPGGEGDQARVGAGGDRVDPPPLYFAQDLLAGRARPDQPAVVAAGEDALPRRMAAGAEHSAVMGLHEGPGLPTHSPVAESESGGPGAVEPHVGHIGVEG